MVAFMFDNYIDMYVDATRTIGMQIGNQKKYFSFTAIITRYKTRYLLHWQKVNVGAEKIGISAKNKIVH